MNDVLIVILIKDMPLERWENEQSDWPIVQTLFQLFEVEGDMHHVVTKVFVRWSTRKRSEAGGSLEGRVKVGFFSLALVIP